MIPLVLSLLAAAEATARVGKSPVAQWEFRKRPAKKKAA